MKTPVKQQLKYLTNICLTIGVFIFAFFYIGELIKEADLKNLNIKYIPMALSSLLFIGYYAFMSMNWLLATKLVMEDVPKSQNLVFLASQPYKYMPSSIFIFSSRAIFAKKLGLSYKKSSIAQLLENSILLLANFFVFAIFYTALLSIYLSIAVFAIGMILLLLLRRRNKIELSLRTKRITANSKILFNMFAASSVGWIMCAISFALFNSALGFDYDVIKIIAANTIAFSLSMLAVFAPGGIGVREAVYGFFSINPAAIIFWRIFVFIFDFLVGALAAIKIRLISKHQTESS